MNTQKKDDDKYLVSEQGVKECHVTEGRGEALKRILNSDKASYVEEFDLDLKKLSAGRIFAVKKA